MALALTQTIIATALTVTSVASVGAQTPPNRAVEAPDAVLSPECRVPGGRLYTLAPLKAVRAVLEEKRPLKVLAIGSAGATTGLGSSTPAATYSVRLEGELQKVLPSIAVLVEQRELPGEITAQAMERISGLVAEVEPDLIVWQVGTSDALAKADLDDFSRALNEVLEWLSSHQMDVVLIEPPYSAALASDEHYTALMTAIQKSARENRVPLVLRFEAMEYLGQQEAAKGRTNQFRLSDLGSRCIAEYVARTVGLSLTHSATPDDQTAREKP